jgi:MFS family permease
MASGGKIVIPAQRRSLVASVGDILFVFPICLLGWCFSNLDQSLFSYAIPGIRQEFGSSLAEVGWILSASFALASVSTVAVGLLSDRFGRRLLFIATLGLSALFVGLQSVASSLLSLAAARILGFALSNGLAPIVITYTAEAAPPRFRGLAVGFLNLGYPLGGMIGGLVAAPLMAAGGWRMVFAPAFMIVPLAIVLGRLLPETRKPVAKAAEADSMTWSERLRALFSPRFRRSTFACMAANFLFGGAYSGTAFYFPTFFHEVRGFTAGRSAELVGAALGIGALGYILSAVVGDFVLARRDTIVLWIWLGTAALLGVIWLPESFAGNLLWMGVMACFFYGTSAAFAAFMPEMFPAHLRATGTAVVGSLAMYAGFALFPPLVADLIARLGWQWAFSFCAVPLFGAGAALLFADRRPNGFGLDAEVAA